MIHVLIYSPSGGESANVKRGCSAKKVATNKAKVVRVVVAGDLMTKAGAVL